MEQRTIQMLFALLRSSIGGARLTDEERSNYSPDLLPDLLKVSQKHDVAHLLALGMRQNGFASEEKTDFEKSILTAVYRYELLKYEYDKLCNILEKEQFPFLPLKGSVVRKYYPEAWMRTSCDIDILVHEEDTERAVSMLINEYGYTYQKTGSHEVLMNSPNGTHVELHFDLIEDGRVNGASVVLKKVWDTASIRDGSAYWHEMPDEMFYFYHISHMAKHFETGGCGIRPFIDLWFLNRIESIDDSKRKELLKQGDLLKFAEAVTKLSEIWFNGAETDFVSQHIEDFIMSGGMYGNQSNYAMVKAAQGESKIKNYMGMIFLSKKNLEMLYPNLERFPFLSPFYQVKRWFGIFNKKRRNKIRELTHIRNSVTKEDINSTAGLLAHLGLDEDES